MYNPTSANSVTVTIIYVSNYIIFHVKCTTVKLTVMHAVIIIPDLNVTIKFSLLCVVFLQAGVQ